MATSRTSHFKASSFETWTSALVLVCPLLLAGVGACASKNAVVTKGFAPASGADARMSLAPRESGNNELAVTVEHLLPPDRIDDRFTHYAVWVVPRDGDIQLAGRLVYDPNERVGTFTTITPYEELRVVVTAESEVRSDRPMGKTIVEGNVTAS